MQSVELRDRSSFGKEIGIEMPGHDFLQHVCEQISFVVTRCEGSYGCAELLKLLGRKAAQSGQCEVERRNFGLHRHDFNFRPDSCGLVQHGFGCDAGENFELFLVHRWLVREEKCANQAAGPKWVTCS